MSKKWQKSVKKCHDAVRCCCRIDFFRLQSGRRGSPFFSVNTAILQIYIAVRLQFLIDSLQVKLQRQGCQSAEFLQIQLRRSGAPLPR
jgi:hypothetical protein